MIMHGAINGSEQLQGIQFKMVGGSLTIIQATEMHLKEVRPGHPL